MPTVVVDGIGLVVLEVPPVGFVYQFRVQFADAIAVKGTAVSLLQYKILLTNGAIGNGFTVTMIATRGLSQPFRVFV